ncbi:glycosyltransferase [Seohaeicola nanhaiensis]|uniref:Glycosyltransferase n=1 Tax=Seohaeicola nanhaiensis TaxID=1387282 RepID=A0ABV9KPR9_9RHOB
MRSLPFGPRGRWAVAVTVPARDEEARIVACLDAAAQSLRGRGGIAVLVNGSSDGTMERAMEWFAATGEAGLVLERPDSPAGGVGEVRRDTVAACATMLAPQGVVMTTDADSRVFEDWVDANLEELRGADLICGSVFPDPAEFARLPPVIAQRGAVEGEYMALTIALKTAIDPVPHDPEPTHLSEPGASLAFRMDLYQSVGGFAAMPGGEDRALAERADLLGWRVRHSARARVQTSCRLSGRAPGGMADALQARIHADDPMVDWLLEPAEATVTRARLWRELRALPADVAPDVRTAARQRLAALPRQRLRLSDLPNEMPRLAAALAAETQGRERISA